jgi:hypothetical protein
MKPFSKIMLTFCICITACSCRKSDSPRNTGVTKDHVDTITGTYYGYMHAYSHVVFYSDYAHPQILDTIYPLTVTIHKVTTDTFSVEGLSFVYWSYPTNTSHIGYQPSGIYFSNVPSGERDTLGFVPVADSIYFRSIYNKPGGATTEYRTQTFSGKKV